MHSTRHALLHMAPKWSSHRTIQAGQIGFFLLLKFLGGMHKYPIGGKLFQAIPRRVAKFRENRPSDVEKSVDGKKEKITQPKHNSLPGDIN